MEGDTRVEESVRVVLRGGASIVDRNPIFSADSKCILCCSGDVIKVLSVASGECIHTLRGHHKKVTGIRLNPTNPYQLLSCSLDQTVIKWNYADGIRIHSYHFNLPMEALYTTGLDDHSLLAIQRLPNQDCRLVEFVLTKQVQDIKFQGILYSISDRPHCTAVGCKGLLVATVKRLTLRVCSLKKDGGKANLSVPGGRFKEQFSCVACHPTEFTVAAGLTNGAIWVWWNVLGKGTSAVKTVKHWHSLCVETLCFSTDGSYMLSGGSECVLVKWQHSSHNKPDNFLPRLGSAILGISTSQDNTLCATTHSDNGLMVISSDSSIVQVFQGLTQACHRWRPAAPVPTGLLLDPRSKALVLNGKPGHLQFYNIHSDQQLYNLDIVRQNYISPENLDHPLAVTEVERAAFDSSGDWLVTLERWDDGVMTPEMRLKFWAHNKESQRFLLNTSVESPHEQPLHTIKFRPSSDLYTTSVVTTSAEGKFKLWALVDDTDIYRANICWGCDSVGFYKDQPAGCADFSEDGSLLAVAFASTLTMWEPTTNYLRTTLAHANGDTEIKQVVFGRAGSSHLVVTATRDCLYSWNLLTCTVHWCLSLNVAVIVANPWTDLIAVFTEDKAVLQVLTPQSPLPIYTKCGVSPSPVLSALFVPHHSAETTPYGDGSLAWQNTAQLYFLNKDQELLTLTLEGDTDLQEMSAQVALAQNLPKTPFSILMASQRKQGAGHGDLAGTKGARFGHMPTRSRFTAEMLSTPAHVMPPMTSLCLAFMDSVMVKQKNSSRRVSEDSEEEEEADEDEHKVAIKIGGDSDSESDMDMQPTGKSHERSSRETESESESESETPGMESETQVPVALDMEYGKLKASSFTWMQKLCS